MVEKISITPEFILDATEELSPPIPFDPQVTTLPSLLRAAKAPSEGKISTTPEPRAVLTEELSPPLEVLPHVITLPSLLRAAKAEFVLKISITPEFTFT